jgi:hypothetical protein
MPSCAGTALVWSVLGSPERLQSFFIFIGPEETKIILFRDFCIEPVFDFLVEDEPLLEFLANILFTL